MSEGACDPRGEGRALISVMVPCFNEQQVLPVLVERLQGLADRLDGSCDCDMEIVLVDDGSTDDSWQRIGMYHRRDRRIHGVRLSRNFGQQAAMTCGYAFSHGDAVVTLDADLQDPPELVPELVARWRAGFDVVYAVRRRREGETVVKLATARFFYWLVRRLGIRHIRAQAGDFRLISRRVVQALLTMPERDRFMRGMVGWVGFPATEVPYDRAARVAGQTKWPLRKMLQLAADAILGYSRLPLRLALAATAGLTAALLIYSAWLPIARARGDQPVEPSGTLLLAAVAAFGLANLLCLSVMAEYIGRVHEQSCGRPLYIVQETTGATRGRSQPATEACLTASREQRS